LKGRAAVWVVVLGWLCAQPASSHPAPNSTLRLEFLAGNVLAEYWLPVSELAHARASEPGLALRDYLLRRIEVRTAAGLSWRIELSGIRADHYLDHDFQVARLTLWPPAGESARRFVLIDDVITHEVRNHLVFVVQNLVGGNRIVGTLQYPARRLEVRALEAGAN
jgi:hypothetical protein